MSIADVNASSPDGKTALMFAAMFDRAEIIDLLLAHGAEPSLQAGDGTTALSLAQAMGAQAAATRLSHGGPDKIPVVPPTLSDE